MAHLPAKPCALHGCKELAVPGERYCKADLRVPPAREPDNRDSANERGYDRQWRKVRAAKLSADPWCELRIVCAGDSLLRQLAVEVHHIERVQVRPDLRLDWDNLMSVCRECHYETRRRRNRADVT
jgi:hypothetical protein